MTSYRIISTRPRPQSIPSRGDGLVVREEPSGRVYMRPTHEILCKTTAEKRACYADMQKPDLLAFNYRIIAI